MPPQMERYVYKRRNDGIYVINLEKTYEKLQMAARVIVAIENPQDVVVQSARPYGQRAVFKFAQYLGAKSLAGRHTPGTFTNQIQKNFVEPRLLLLTDPRYKYKAVIMGRSKGRAAALPMARGPFRWEGGCHATDSMHGLPSYMVGHKADGTLGVCHAWGGSVM